MNLRHGFYGVAASRFLRGGWTHLLAAHFVNDETVAYASVHQDSPSRRQAFWVLGWAILLSWPLGAAIGALLGRAVADVSALGLDAVFPTILCAMLLGAVQRRRTTLIVLCGALVAAVVTLFVPLGVGPLVALISLGLLIKRGPQRG